MLKSIAKKTMDRLKGQPTKWEKYLQTIYMIIDTEKIYEQEDKYSM